MERQARTVNWHIETSGGIQQEINTRTGFEDFVANIVLRHMMKDSGDVSREEAEHNNHNPMAALGSYLFRDEIRVYVKAEDGCLRIFLSEEC